MRTKHENDKAVKVEQNTVIKYYKATEFYLKNVIATNLTLLLILEMKLLK